MRTVEPGSRLGPYEIVARIGAGGMGEVYRARDTRLDRSVAIKVIAPNVSTNPQFRERLLREARTISRLSHPSICTLFDVGTEGDTSYLVMELLEGQTLADRLASGPLPLKEVTRLGEQIALALEQAHRAGVVHRDLKPGNIMITRSGAKLLDFGLARGGTGELAADSPTQRMELSEPGTVMGTLPYMSPEQLHGSAVDHRADIFAFGAVLYEMITGERAFKAASAASLIATILDHEPKLREKNVSAPPALEHLVTTCLQKDPDQRFQSAADVAIQLRWVATNATAERVDAAADPPGRRMWGIVIASIVALAVAGAAVIMKSFDTAAAPPAATFSALTYETGEEHDPSISPDGKLFAFAKAAGGKRDIFLQRTDGRSAINLTNTPDVDESEPVFSPDGSLIAFRSDRDGGGIFLMGATGESVRRLTDSGFSPSWSPDGREIVFAGQWTDNPAYVYGVKNLYIVELSTGKTRILLDEVDVLQPAWSPDGRRIAFWKAVSGRRDIFTIASSGEPSSVVPVTSDPHLDWNPVWSPDGRYIYFSSDRDGARNIWRIPVRDGKPAGEPEPLRTPSRNSDHISLSSDGSRLLYQTSTTEGQLLRLDFDPVRESVAAETSIIHSSAQHIRWPSPSPDGRWIAFGVVGQQEDVYVMSADGSDIRQLTSDTELDRGMAWWPDSSRIVFYSNREKGYQIWTIRPDGSGLRRLSEFEEEANFPRLSHDATRLAYIPDAGGPTRIADVQADGSLSAGKPVTTAPDGRFVPASWSPSGDWIAGLPYPGSGLTFYSTRKDEVIRTEIPSRAAAFLDDDRVVFVDEANNVGVLQRSTMKHRIVGAVPPDEGMRTDAILLSPDGTTLFIFRMRVESDIWQMTFSKKKD